MLQVDALDCARGARTILQGISFQLAAGEVLAVLGTNGAGKSTLLASLSGELTPLGGSIMLSGRPLAGWSAQERARRMAVLPQSSTLAFAFSVAEVVALGRLPHATGRQQDELIVEQAMAATDVTQLRERSYLTLSGGERQRVHLARVLTQIWDAGEQGCLLLDEPTASLDLAHQQLILQQARDMAERGLAVVVVLHDLNLAARYADRLLLLHQGRVSALGTPWQVLSTERVAEVFGVAVRVEKHPLQDSPLIIV
ncbi:heme ABC transporter ATP-binding protein [Halopseudomonas sp.]|uniref:heme ABC transporter ATP-binding protein n=1 Tax=Halopseudomonas sp. TaxID=2901191 RepID=UPI003003A006